MRSRLLATTIVAGVAWGASLPAFAQTAPLPTVNVSGEAESQATEIDEVVVTGSRIRRDPTNSPTPLIQVSREALLTSGQSTVIDFLATIPALSNSLVPSDTVGSDLGGLSAANLRSLGRGRTLTLVDGRRHVGSETGALAVDVDTIPRLLIENIEIITGGASSVYGADAVSGVLNFQLRRDFEGLEIDANYGMINQGGQANRRLSALVGANIFDDRLNLWAFAEYEELDEVRNLDIDWLRANYVHIGADVDPTNPAFGPPSDGIIDQRVYSGARLLQRVRWSIVNLANNVPASPLSDPDIPFFNCPSGTSYTNNNCTTPNPGYSFVFDGAVGRPTDFGTRIGTGFSRLFNIGGDGEDYSEFSQFSFFPQGETTRYAAGANFSITDDILFRVEAKQTQEATFAESQATFFDIYINNGRTADQVSEIRGATQYTVRLSDNAFLPANVRTAIENNRLILYTNPTATSPGLPRTDPVTGDPLTVAAPFARNALRGVDNEQTNTRELTRFVASLEGTHDRFAFLNNVRWDLSYTYGEVEVEQVAESVDTERQAYATDAVFDTAGLVNGRPGEIVCRVQLLQAQNVALIEDQVRGGDLRANPIGQQNINECEPLNMFGKGNQSAEALAYIQFAGDSFARNEQEQAIAAVSGELWDFWGAGRIGGAVGVEYRREFTEGVGYEDENENRLTQGFDGGFQPAAQYESEEAFAELSIPLIRDNWLGEYAEISGSYRYFDYTTVGTGDVYGVNFIYRPIRDVTFRTSFNSSFRAPNLGENFAPLTPAFANFAFTDPCSTTNINAPANQEFRTNRIANCTALAQQQGLTFDFAGATATTTDDFDPTPLGSGSVVGSAGGNPFLQPEESESFTFSTVIEPRMFPNFSLVLDYYEIEISNVIAAISPNIAANNCVDGPSLNQGACATIFRNNPFLPFAIGGPASDPIGAFIQGSINYAKLTTRGLDFTARYRLDLEEAVGRNWGNLDYRLGGSWLIEQKNFNNAEDPSDFTGLDSDILYPRVRLTSSLTYAPNDEWSVNWTMDWQTAQDTFTSAQYGASGNVDSRLPENFNTGNFARHDFTVRWNAADNLSIRAGVVNAFDAEQARYLGNTLYSNFDPYGTRFFIGLNYRPF
ncbi:TonB-dependent receptor [Aquidulcibacter paucihalophilus]|nr:TonB-dependent receptor [Aquidulcibacter paucihalophilus]